MMVTNERLAMMQNPRMSSTAEDNNSQTMSVCWLWKTIANVEKDNAQIFTPQHV
jgi:hypothetical protein